MTDFNLVDNIEQCRILIQNDVPLNLVYYSHFPTALVALFFGFFVFIKTRSLASRILLIISAVFSLWLCFDFITWTSFDSIKIMNAWSLLGIFDALLYIFSLYFVYVFIDKKDVSLPKKITWLLLFFPILLMVPTNLNLKSFDVPSCLAVENNYLLYYLYFIEGLMTIWILILSFQRYRKADKDFRKQILLLTFGIVLFLFSFFFAGFLGSYLAESGMITGFGYELYGLFGVVIFMSFLAYLIVQYKAFDIKVLSVQALVVALVILIGSQFAFIQNPINMVLTGITLAIAVGFGWMLIRSVKMEVQRKEELQVMTNRLAQANDQLRKLDNAKSEFISIASHQLRTPLTAIKGFISLLLEGSYGKISPMLKEVLNKIYISNERLIDLVEDMLNLSRIESGRMEYDIKKVNMEEVLKEICDTFLIRSKEKGLKLELKLPENPLPEVSTDRNKIREVISNLVDNAIKYTLKGWITVKLLQKEDKVQIIISDTGIGVPKEEMPYLFEKFSRGKDINRLNTGGTGLGLHVGKKMIESLSGTLWVESEGAGKGSAFFVEVPMEIKEAK